MRIISGSLKGRSILVPKNFKGRPTTDFAREGLFNVLGNIIDITNADILDLFAGTGAFSIECLSRGAKSTLAVEIQPLHVKFIHQNLDLFSLDNGNAIRQDVIKFIAQCQMNFDLVFADPPYDLIHLNALPDKIMNSSLLRTGGWFVLEHGKYNDFSGHQAFVQSRQYSNVFFSFFQVK
jgi:16S rRNA (guanine966-N2)-methyltransferase